MSTSSPTLPAREKLSPLFSGVIKALANDGGTGSFFEVGALVQALQDRLQAVESERELIRLLLDTTMIRHLGVELSDSAEHAVSALLDECEKMLRTLALDDESH